MAWKVSDVDDGGYDVKFIEEPPEFLLCIVCHLALRNPIQIIDCGHRFCRTCFEKMKKTSNERGSDLLCPLDRDVIDLSKVFPDKGYERIVLELKVYCDNQRKGCQWKGDLSSLKPHLDTSCIYEFTSCGYEGCNEKSERRSLEEHMSTCSKRVVAVDDLTLIQILTQQLQSLHESQEEIKEQLREGKDELNETKEQLKETKERLKLKESELITIQERINVLEKDVTKKIQESQKEVKETKEQLITREKEMSKYRDENDLALKKCKEELTQKFGKIIGRVYKPDAAVLSKKIDAEVIQVKHGEWFTLESDSKSRYRSYSLSHLTDDGYHFKLRSGRDDYGLFHVDMVIFTDELERGHCTKNIRYEIGCYNNCKIVDFYKQCNYFDPSLWWESSIPISSIHMRYTGYDVTSFRVMIEDIS